MSCQKYQRLERELKEVLGTTSKTIVELRGVLSGVVSHGGDAEEENIEAQIYLLAGPLQKGESSIAYDKRLSRREQLVNQRWQMVPKEVRDGVCAEAFEVVADVRKRLNIWG